MPRLTRGRDKKINFPKDLEEVYPASLCESIEQTLS